MSNAVATTQNNNNNALVSIADIEWAANKVAKSGLFGIKSPDEAATLMLLAQSEGTHFMTAMREYHVIKGRPSMKAEAMLARYQRAGGKVFFKKREDDIVEATFTHPQSGDIYIKWTYADAEKAGYTKVWDEKVGQWKVKDNWRQKPRQMLHARVVSEGVRSSFPACIQGFYTPEEVQDFEPQKPAEPLKAEVEVVQEPAKETPKITVNINGGGNSNAVQDSPKQPQWIKNLCEFIKDLNDQAKATQIIKKYCKPKDIATLGEQQVCQLVNELCDSFGLTYFPEIFGKQNTNAIEDGEDF